ncbi:MAG: hypothetical protein P1Q69_04745 [Candidatus Thorarchaeota archaeon]|nr:hypothetical protein [Candidatus Thorarchaeota archaeon]
MSRFARVLLLVLILAVAPSIFTQPVAAQEPGGGGAQRALFEVGDFTYRASFQLEDGTEALLIRSAYKAMFLYQHHQPTLNHHYISVSIGFYFGKTVLGRSLIESMNYDEIAFYPKWQDSAGYAYDMYLDTAVFSITGSMTDGRLVGGYMLIDDNAISQYLPMFGGTLVLSGLVLGLIDGSEVSFGDEPISITLEKYSNKFYPENATLTEGDITYESSDGYINISTAGASQVVVLIDLFIGLAMIGTAGTVVLLGLLHLRGMVKLPISRITSMIQRPVPPQAI